MASCSAFGLTCAFIAAWFERSTRSANRSSIAWTTPTYYIGKTRFDLDKNVDIASRAALAAGARAEQRRVAHPARLQSCFILA